MSSGLGESSSLSLSALGALCREKRIFCLDEGAAEQFMRHGPHRRIDPFGPALCCGIAANGRGVRRPCV